MNGSPSPTVTTAHPSLPQGRIRGCGLFLSGCKIRIQTSRTTENRCHVGSAHAILVSLLLAGRRGPARHPQPLPVCPLSKLSLSLLLQEVTQCFSVISLMKFLKGSNRLYTSPAFPQPSPLCVQHRTELMENNDKDQWVVD